MRNSSREPGSEFDTDAGPDGESVNKAPRWVKVSAIIFGVLVLLVVIVLLLGGNTLGEHGPARHMSGSQPIGQPDQQAPIVPQLAAGSNR